MYISHLTKSITFQAIPHYETTRNHPSPRHSCPEIGPPMLAEPNRGLPAEQICNTFKATHSKRTNHICVMTIYDIGKSFRHIVYRLMSQPQVLLTILPASLLILFTLQTCIVSADVSRCQPSSLIITCHTVQILAKFGHQTRHALQKSVPASSGASERRCNRCWHT